MNRDEAEKLAVIVGTADNGCSYCVRSLVEQLNEAALGWVFETGARAEYSLPPRWEGDLNLRRLIVVTAQPKENAMDKALALSKIKALRDEINSTYDDKDMNWSNEVCSHLDRAADVIEFPKSSGG